METVAAAKSIQRDFPCSASVIYLHNSVSNLTSFLSEHIVFFVKSTMYVSSIISMLLFESPNLIENGLKRVAEGFLHPSLNCLLKFYTLNLAFST